MFALLRNLLLVAVALALVPAVASARWVYETATEFHFSGAAGTGRVIEIKGVVGDVVAEPSSNGEVEVVAVKKSATQADTSRVKLEVTDHAHGTTVSAVYPEGDRGGVTVNFHVRVPPGVRFVGRTANGKVAATRLLGPVEAHTVNGDIDIHTSGEATADTVNGSITARLDSKAAAASLKTVNGNVTVNVAPDTAAVLVARTINGAITTAVPMRHREDSIERFYGILGRGGATLDLSTVNGDIVLLSR